MATVDCVGFINPPGIAAPVDYQPSLATLYSTANNQANATASFNEILANNVTYSARAQLPGGPITSVEAKIQAGAVLKGQVTLSNDLGGGVGSFTATDPLFTATSIFALTPIGNDGTGATFLVKPLLPTTAVNCASAVFPAAAMSIPNTSNTPVTVQPGTISAGTGRTFPTSLYTSIPQSVYSLHPGMGTYAPPGGGGGSGGVWTFKGPKGMVLNWVHLTDGVVPP